METEVKAPTYSRPKELQFQRIDGMAEGNLTALPSVVKAAFDAVGCRLSWRRHAPEVVSMGLLNGHRVVTRGMLERMVLEDKDELERLTEGLQFDESDNVVRGDAVLCARSVEAYEAERELWAQRALRPTAHLEAQAELGDSVEELMAALSRDGVQFSRPQETLQAMRTINSAVDPLDMVTINKNPV